jgi:pimeloyl-ACP methyl ester carboxylesterase
MKHLLITTIAAVLFANSVCAELITAKIPRKLLISHKLKINDHTFAVYEKKADSSSDIILFVHGRTISSLPNFNLQIESKNVSVMDAFVAKGFTVYAIDLRGFGNTPRDDSAWITPNKASSDVIKMLEWITARHPKNKKPALFGYSLGSLVSQLVVQQKPNLVSELVLFGYPIRYLDKIDASAIKKDKTIINPPRKPNTVEWSSDGFITSSITQEVIDGYVSACLSLDSTLADWNNIAQWNQLDPLAITAPTLLINGEHDPYAPADKLASFFSKIGNPDKTWVVITKSGHNAHIEDSAVRLVNGIVNFVRRYK